MTHPDIPKPASAQQQIIASDGATIQNVIQATGNVEVNNKIYSRSDLEELNEYLARAVANYERRIYQTLRRPPAPDHPYKFLYPYTLGDAQLFFGRAEATEDLYRMTIDNRLTVLHARSGAGKTSLLNAGLSPRLIEDARIPVYIRIRPYKENPVEELKRIIAPPSLGPWPDLLANLSLHVFLGIVCHYLNRQTSELVIIFDQFEQFIVSLPEPEVRLPFIKLLRDCYEDETLPIRFVIALRRENLWDLDEFAQFIPTILQNRYGLPQMSRSDVEQVITQPLQQLQKGHSVEPALLQTLIDDLGGKDIELTHLQIVCSHLYDSLPEGEKVLSVALYESLGKAKKILKTYLVESLSTLPPYKQLVARTILKELVSSEATNRILSLPALTAVVPPDVSQIEEVLDYLVERRLVRLGDDVEPQEYELAHAYLAAEISHWVNPDDLATKRAQDLLQRELANWRVHRTFVDEEKLNILRKHIDFLALDKEAQDLLFLSALDQGHDVAFWLERTDAKEEAVQQIAAQLGVVEPDVAGKIADDLRTKLEPPLRPRLLSLLWASFDKAKGTRKQGLATTLWKFRPWLSAGEIRRAFPAYAVGWARRSYRLLALVLSVLILASLLGWTFVSKERPVAGKWVTIAAGDFVMGMDEDEAKLAAALCLEGAFEENKDKCSKWTELRDWSGRQVNATLPDFQILDDEVTNVQYQQCVDEGSCLPPDNWKYEAQNLNQPATNLNWLESQAYCEWLGGRLPTEAEWEKAARGPNNSVYPWGQSWEDEKANIEHSGITTVRHIVSEGNSDVSGYGIKNMAGNVREWTASAAFPVALGQQFLNEVFVPEDATIDFPVVVRGGAWINERSTGMASFRGGDSMLSRRETLGFRCVCPEGQSCESPWTLTWIWFHR